MALPSAELCRVSPSFLVVLGSCHSCSSRTSSNSTNPALRPEGATEEDRGLLCFSEAERDRCLMIDCETDAWAEQTPLHCPGGNLGHIFSPVLVFTVCSTLFFLENRDFAVKQPEAHSVTPCTESICWEQETEDGGEGRALQPDPSVGLFLVLAVSESRSLHALRLCCHGPL